MHLIASLNGGRADLQRVRLRQDLSSDVGDGDPGLLLLDDQDGVEMTNLCRVPAWPTICALPGTGSGGPGVVARRARFTAAGDSVLAATAPPERRPGAGSPCADGCCRTATKPVPRSRSNWRAAPSSAGFLAEAYGLTARERRVAAGRSSRKACPTPRSPPAWTRRPTRSRTT